MDSDIFSDTLRIPLECPVTLLAPMEGVTNETVRAFIANTGGPDLVATEFFRITGPKQKAAPFIHCSKPMQIQIMGKDGSIIAECLSFLKSEGLISEDDWLDLNIGCPSKRVNSRGAGAALLKTPEKIREIVCSLRESHSGPLSVKTRLGFDTTTDYAALLAMFAKTPLDFITFHARTRCGGYETPIQYEPLRQAVESLPFPVIGNGDIMTAEDAERMIRETGVRGVMCGRGALANPLLFCDIKSSTHQSSPQDQRKAVHKLLLQVISEYQKTERRPGCRIGGAKEIVFWCSRNPNVGAELFQATKRAQSYAELEQRIEEFFQYEIGSSRDLNNPFEIAANQ